MAAAVRPSSHRYASADPSSSSPSPSSSSSSDHKKNPLPSALSHLIPHSSSRRDSANPQAAAAAMPDGNPNHCRALAKPRSADILPVPNKNGHNFGSMVRKLMEKKKSNPKTRPADPTALLVPPPHLLGEGLNKGAKGSHLSALSRKLFQKKGGAADCAAGKALVEVKSNTRTLAMVLRSERELLTQNKHYEEEITELRLLLEEKNREVEKLKDLCLKQREEIKALKDAILFPDVMNSQLQELLEKQGSELRQAKHVIPSLQKQVTSLTGQLRCLAEDLAEVKADKYAAMGCFDDDLGSPRTPMFDKEADSSVEYSSVVLNKSEYGSPDEKFLKDFNPCLTPCFSKMKSQEYDEMGCPKNNGSNGSNTCSNPDMFRSSRGVILSKSSEHLQKPILGSCSRKICKSDENKWYVGKPRYHNLLS